MKYGFGVDLGGTTVKIAFFDETGLMIDKWEIPTVTANGGSQILPDIAASIQQFIEQKTVDPASVIGVGIGVPGPVSNKGIVNKAYHLVRRLMLQKKARLVEKLTLLKNGKILDYGAGTGHFARTMADRGWSVTAIEKNAKAREFAQQEYGFGMRPVEAMAGIAEREMDVVTMWHVMEHVQDLDNMWKELYRILDDTGIAIIAVPNCSSYDAQKYKEHWAAYDVPRHLWHFTPSSIMRWGEKHGFLLERQYTMPFDGFYISMLSEQNKGSRLHTLKGFCSGFMGWMAQWKRRSASSSIIYVFRKKQ